jgi:hypothetical protein
MQQDDYLHVQHNQPAGFTTLCPTMALCFSKYDNSGIQPPQKQFRPPKKKQKVQA